MKNLFSKLFKKKQPPEPEKKEITEGKIKFINYTRSGGVAILFSNGFMDTYHKTYGWKGKVGRKPASPGLSIRIDEFIKTGK